MGAFKEGFVTLNWVPTHICTWGGWIEDSSIAKSKEIILLFTGNPGVAMYYYEFLEQLHRNLEMPVWVVSHAGHELPEDRLAPSLDKNKHLFDLDGQMKNKREFVDRFVPKGCKIHLLGHSVGAYMALHLMKDDDFAGKVQRSYLLFPVLENIATTPNGLIFGKVVVHILWLVYFLAGIFDVLPRFIKWALISGYLSLFGTGTSSTVKQSTIKLINPKTLRTVFFLAKDEMSQIQGLDVDLITKRRDKISVYYGGHDRWAPITHYENLVKAVPGVEAQVCKKGLDHAFMLCQPSSLMAEVMEDMISKNRKDQ